MTTTPLYRKTPEERLPAGRRGPFAIAVPLAQVRRIEPATEAEVNAAAAAASRMAAAR